MTRTCLALLFVLASTLAAHADDSTNDRREANALYKEGVRLFGTGEFPAALDMFQSAYKRWPDSRIEYSIATTLRKIGRLVEAANAYDAFIADPKAEPKLVVDAKVAISALHANLGRLEVSFDGPPGEIRIDGGAWLATDHVFILPGSFTVDARRDGFTAEASGRVEAGAVEHVALHWQPLEQPRPLPISKPPPLDPPHAAELDATTRPPGWSRRKKLAIAIGGAGAALAAGAVVLELGSRSRISSARTICPDLACAEPEYGQAHALLDAAGTRHTFALVLAGTAVASIAAGAALWLTDHPSRIRITPTSDGDSVELVVAGHF